MHDHFHKCKVCTYLRQAERSERHVEWFDPCNRDIHPSHFRSQYYLPYYLMLLMFQLSRNLLWRLFSEKMKKHSNVDDWKREMREKVGGRVGGEMEKKKNNKMRWKFCEEICDKFQQLNNQHGKLCKISMVKFKKIFSRQRNFPPRKKNLLSWENFPPLSADFLTLTIFKDIRNKPDERWQ